MLSLCLSLWVYAWLYIPAVIAADTADIDAETVAVQKNPNPALSGGKTTVFDNTANAFSQPSANMSLLRRLDFSMGNSFFRNPWVIAPATTTARDGLGPLFNTNACQNCHIKDGRGHPPESADDNAVSLLLRLSVPAHNNNDMVADILKQQGVLPVPNYGAQLQDMAIPGVAAEGKIYISYEEMVVPLLGEEPVSLRRPKVQMQNLAYGSLPDDVQISARVAPPMIGLGLLEAIPESALKAYADEDDADSDGISGRFNQVWSIEQQQTVIGRFGWKAGQPGLAQQNAAAFLGDMGLSTRLLRQQNCTTIQVECQQAPDGSDMVVDDNGYEVSDTVFDAVLFYSRNLAVPARRNMESPLVTRGEQIFHEVGCDGCHVPSYTTVADGVEPELAGQTIFPYTDLLLHDMGEGLADNRPEFLATGREWRTPPLWGIGLTKTVNGHSYFLHDGRARNLLEAILWHGGEAEQARQQVINLVPEQRQALIHFLESL